MGPPKKGHTRVPHSELMKQLDIFEYRWNETTKSYYLFNPYTGETVMQSEGEVMNRTVSLWALPDSVRSTISTTINLYPEKYQSRHWGCRPFKGWDGDKEAAAIHMTAVARGFIARKTLSKYFENRYFTSKDDNTGYLFFTDTHFPDKETSWYKPLLAMPWDIKFQIVPDPEDYVPDNNKYSDRGFTLGPFLKKTGLGKGQKGRADVTAFQILNPWRDQAISKLEQIDLDKTPISSLIAWMEGSDAISVCMDEYLTIRTAAVNGDWRVVLQQMEKYPNNGYVQMFGLRAFAKTAVPMTADYLAAESVKVFHLTYGLVCSREKSIKETIRLFSLQVLLNILSLRLGRALFFDTNEVTVQGDERAAAVEKFLANRMCSLNSYLVRIPTDKAKTSMKGSKTFIEYEIPTRRGSELAQATLQCLGCLAHETETREQMATLLSHPVVRCLQICEVEVEVVTVGLQLLYNFCYRAEGGQEAVLSVKVRKALASAHYYHSGDPECARQTRRLELALKENGWRGFIEELIEKECYMGEELDEMYLQEMPGGYGGPEDEDEEAEAAEKKAKAHALAVLEEEEEEERENEQKKNSNHDDDDLESKISMDEKNSVRSDDKYEMKLGIGIKDEDEQASSESKGARRGSTDEWKDDDAQSKSPGKPISLIDMKRSHYLDDDNCSITSEMTFNDFN